MRSLACKQALTYAHTHAHSRLLFRRLSYVRMPFHCPLTSKRQKTLHAVASGPAAVIPHRSVWPSLRLLRAR
eukprot:4937724-Pleurochrysis_carterae.AAC.1